ncbi:MAG: DinB family protein [Christensenellaceae bacterium]|jgi:hypothetical protein
MENHFTSDWWNKKQKRLREIIKKRESFPEAIALIKALHGHTHTQAVYPTQKDSALCALLHDFSPPLKAIMPKKSDVTIAWNLWHITRIEDIVTSILILEQSSLLTTEIMQALEIPFYDTGNAWNDAEIILFSDKVNFEALIDYRNNVGLRTKEMLGTLSFEMLSRKVSPVALAHVLQEGGVTSAEDSIWLLDFWGKKDIAGLLLMPITRHQRGHLYDALRLKEQIPKQKYIYLQPER